MAKRQIPLARTVEGGRRHDYVNPPDPLNKQTPRPAPPSSLKARDWDRMAAGREVSQGKAEAQVINAEARDVADHLVQCDPRFGDDPGPGLCVRHGWLKGMRPYGWSTTEGGFLDYRTPEDPVAVCSTCGANAHDGNCADGSGVADAAEALREAQREARKTNHAALAARRNRLMQEG